MKCEHGAKCKREHEAKYECKHEARAQSEMCEVGCTLFIPFYLYVQVISPTPRSGEGSGVSERTRVPLTTKHRGILSYVLDGVRRCLDICSIILSRSRWC